MQFTCNGRNQKELFHTASSSLCFKSSANSARVSLGFFPLSTAILSSQSLRNLFSMYMASAQHASAASVKGQLKCKTKTSKQTIYSHLNTKLYFLIIFALSLTKLLPSLWLLDTPGFRHFVFLLPFSKRGWRHNVKLAKSSHINIRISR